jgi:hypothetical protein
MLKAFALRADALRRNWFNARPIGSALFNPICCVRSSPPVADVRTDDLGRPIPRCHALTLICPPPLADASFGETGCVCLHALSSFQRTRPHASAPGGCRDLRRTAPDCRQCHHGPHSGEPFNTTEVRRPCQSLFGDLCVSVDQSRPNREGRKRAELRNPLAGTILGPNLKARQDSRTNDCCRAPLRRSTSRPPMA